MTLCLLVSLFILDLKHLGRQLNDLSGMWGNIYAIKAPFVSKLPK
jgi:hypothetical protein